MVFDLDERFWEKVDKSGPEFVDENGVHRGPCHLWTSAKTRGYGVFTIGRKVRYAHRLAYEYATQTEIGELVIDHVCRNPPCVNWTHMDPVTRQENHRRGHHEKPMLRFETCPRHPGINNDYYWRGKRRHCRLCRNEYLKNKRAERSTHV